MTEAGNPNFPYDGDEDSLVRAASTNANMDLASRDPWFGSAGLAGNNHGGAKSPAQSSKPGSDTAETASIPAPTVEDAIDGSGEAGNSNADNGSSIHGRLFHPTPAYRKALDSLRNLSAAVQSGDCLDFSGGRISPLTHDLITGRPFLPLRESTVSPSANCSDCKHDDLMSSLIHRLQHTEPEATCNAHPDHLPSYRLREADALKSIPCDCRSGLGRRCAASKKQRAAAQGPRPEIKMRVQAEKTGDRDFTLRVHWDDEETGEAIATPASSGPAVTRASPADLGRLRDDLDDAPAQLIEPHNNIEPIRETETETETETKEKEEEEVDPHSLPEIHHQQQRSTASAAPDAGSRTRAIPPGSLLNYAVDYGHRSPVFNFPSPQQPYAAQPYAAQPYAAQPYAAQFYAAQPYTAQAYTAQYMGNEPYLVVNPPVVPPAVQATVPGTASWSYPNYRQTSFHSGTAHWRTNPPIIVGQPGPQQPTIVNGETHNIIYYR
ncbi:hypothetical protein LQW54_000713 [Pestalotiopsis sp. IQ-011]